MSAPLAGRRVLVLEDEYLAAMEMRQSVERLGAAVVGPAGRLADAEALLADGLPDAAVLDIQLNGDTSYDFAARLRSLGVAVVFVTGYGEATRPQDGADIPRTIKPVTERTLERALRSALAAAKAADGG